MQEDNCVTLFGKPEKSQTLQEPQSETAFAQLNLLCIMAAPWADDVSVLMENFCFTFRQNEVLWREVVSLRQNHSQQQKVINKVVVIQTPNSLVLPGLCPPLIFFPVP